MNDVNQEETNAGESTPSLVGPMIFTLLLVIVGSGIMSWFLFARRAPAPLATGDTTFQPASLDRPVPAFKLINQEGKEITLDDLKGKIWVASFIFTRCHSSCPTVSATMARLREELPKDVQLVSFSVDPRHDTPEVLATYAKHFLADPSRWYFLTGDRDQIYRVSKEGFLLAVEENPNPNADPGDLVMHSNRVVIVDPEGIARTTYNCMDPASVDLIKREVEKMEKESPASKEKT